MLGIFKLKRIYLFTRFRSLFVDAIIVWCDISGFFYYYCVLGARRGEARRGEARRDEARRGEARRGGG